MGKNSNKIVAVAMSGGVDSSVAAILLQEKGYNVFGITMIHYESSCYQAQKSAQDAAHVCSMLGIQHHVIDIKKEFTHNVINNFLQEYLSGRTPNPCVRCNVTIKWGVLFSKALELGADYFATGHYVRISRDLNTRRYVLSKSSNRLKDQSYALWRLKQEHLSRTLFPLEGLDKNQVRTIAAQHNLAIAEKQESQDVCFIPDDDYKRFITDVLKYRNDKIQGGDILNMEGKIIGQHKGYPFYTIGQRRGLGIAVGRPQFVVDIFPDTNQIRIGDKKDLMAKGLIAIQTNWIAIEKPEEGISLSAHIRYNDPGYAAHIKDFSDDHVKVLFENPRHSVTPGQSAVFYDRDRLLGGGIILRAIK